MILGGLIRFTLLDFPGRISCVVFTAGCNLRCPFCYNKDLVLNPEGKVDVDDFFSWLETRKGKLEGVAITGGEPTLHADIVDFVRRIKEMGFDVKMDTNGTNPEVLREVIKHLDYVAMDVKGPLDQISKYVGVRDNTLPSRIRESIRIVMSSGVPYEFRTTVVPGLHDEDAIASVGEEIRGANLWVLQQFRPENTIDPSFSSTHPFYPRELERLAEVAKKYVKNVKIRGV